MSERVAYHCAPSIVWVQDNGRIQVVDRETGHSWMLRGKEMVVWDLLNLGYTYQKLVKVLSLIFDLAPEKGAQVLIDLLSRWHDAGILMGSEKAGDGESGH